MNKNVKDQVVINPVFDTFVDFWFFAEVALVLLTYIFEWTGRDSTTYDNRILRLVLFAWTTVATVFRLWRFFLKLTTGSSTSQSK